MYLIKQNISQKLELFEIYTKRILFARSVSSLCSKNQTILLKDFGERVIWKPDM